METRTNLDETREALLEMKNLGFIFNSAKAASDCHICNGGCCGAGCQGPGGFPKD